MNKNMYYLTAFSLVAVIIVNYLANILPLNGLTTEEISDMFPVLFTPAGYVFSIWGLIYLLLIGFVIHLFIYKPFNKTIPSAVGGLFILSCILNIMWVFSWHFLQIPLSMIIMLALLITLTAIYLLINRKKTEVSTADKILVKLPFSIYLGWISVAAIANFNVLLYYLGYYFSGISASFLTILMLIIATIIASLVFLSRNDFAYILVFLWAFIGIGIRHGTDFFMITLTVWLATAFLIVFMIWVSKDKILDNKGLSS